MIHGHDEVAIHQFCFQEKCWYVNGAAQLLPKNNGASIMASEFMCRETGLGMSHGDLLTEEILDKINKSRDGNEGRHDFAVDFEHSFPKLDKYSENDGPYWMNKEEKNVLSIRSKSRILI